MKRLLDNPLFCSTLVTLLAFVPLVYSKYNSERGIRFSDALIILVFYVFVNWIFEGLSDIKKGE